MAQLASGDRVLVLGGSGFIGGHLLAELARRGVEVTSLDVFDPPRPLPAGVRHVRGDVRDLEALDRAADGVTAIINLAAAHHDFGIPTEVFESVNVEGPRNVCRVAEQRGITELCFYSSVAVYGGAPGVPDEDTVPQPENDYGRTKLAGEQVYREWRDAAEGRRLLVVRPAVVFGEHNFANVFRLMSQIDRRRFLPVGPGTNRKSMCAVTNLVAATIALWTAPPARADEVYNYVDKPDLTSREVVETIYAAPGRRTASPRGSRSRSPSPSTCSRAAWDVTCRSPRRGSASSPRPRRCSPRTACVRRASSLGSSCARRSRRWSTGTAPRDARRPPSCTSP